MSFKDKLIKNLVFGRFALNSSAFEKLLILYLCISFMKYYAMRSFYIKLLYFSKIWFFQIFDRLNLFLDQSKLRLNFFVWICLSRLVVDRCSTDWKWKIFSFLVFDRIFFFMHHLCLGFTCIALIFCIHLAVLQSYLSLFSHITCIHFVKLGT